MPKWKWESNQNSHDIEMLIRFTLKGTEATIIL